MSGGGPKEAKRASKAHLQQYLTVQGRGERVLARWLHGSRMVVMLKIRAEEKIERCEKTKGMAEDPGKVGEVGPRES